MQPPLRRPGDDVRVVRVAEHGAGFSEGRKSLVALLLLRRRRRCRLFPSTPREREREERRGVTKGEKKQNPGCRPKLPSHCFLPLSHGPRLSPPPAQPFCVASVSLSSLSPSLFSPPPIESLPSEAFPRRGERGRLEDLGFTRGGNAVTTFPPAEFDFFSNLNSHAIEQWSSPPLASWPSPPGAGSSTCSCAWPEAAAAAAARPGTRRRRRRWRC